MSYNLTTITDWGINNQYFSIFYGELLKNNIDATVIGTSNDIHPNDFTTAHYLFSSTWHHFPDNTIHLISINSNIPPENGFLYIRGFNHHFICPNNGVLYHFINNNFLDLSIYKIKNETINYSSFYELEYYIYAITNICNRIEINSWTTPITDEKLIIPYFFPKPQFNNNVATGEVIHIDNFGNIITNINFDFFSTNLMNNKWQISLRHYKIYNLYNGYIDANDQNIFAFFNSQNLLELGIKGYNASELLGVKKGDKIYIKIIT